MATKLFSECCPHTEMPMTQLLGFNEDNYAKQKAQLKRLFQPAALTAKATEAEAPRRAQADAKALKENPLDPSTASTTPLATDEIKKLHHYSYYLQKAALKPSGAYL
jgi:hypothetical protein